MTSSMDALEDTHHAISAFVTSALKLEPKPQERELGEAREGLGAAAFQAAWEAGRKLTMVPALAVALEEEHL